uniref:Nitrate/nitrite transporter n=1 Tax=Moniliophthora roreri TaxID=221103 RepID=A0A0W0F1J7_MONRR
MSRLSHTWKVLTTADVNPANQKCRSLPILSLRNQYSVNFLLSWLGFWSAFLSWFAFSPLIPEAVKEYLKLTSAQIGKSSAPLDICIQVSCSTGNSNIISLLATLVVRIIVGPLVDAYGPRKVMACLLILGAIPSGLPGTITSVGGLYVVRLFIGILGGTFVCCQAWTTVFFDTNIVGTANAISAGWGNSGGGFTFIIMVALYDRLIKDGVSQHVAWRAAFAIVPVPVLITVAVLCLVFGTDHPNGRWADRFVVSDSVPESPKSESSIEDKDNEVHHHRTEVVLPELESEAMKAVNQKLTPAVALKALSTPLTWLPALAYMTTFGFELAIDAYLAHIIFDLYKTEDFGQTKAGYLAATFGLMNVFTRALGGWAGDLLYARYGVPGKKYLTVACGILQGVLSLAWGFYIDSRPDPPLGVFVLLMALCALFNEAGNGANFALVPHCNPNSNGSMSGFPNPLGKAFWISGVLAVSVNLLLVPISVPTW